MGRSFTVAKGFVPLKKTDGDNSNKMHQLYHFLPTHAHTLGFQVFISGRNCNVEIPQFLSEIHTENHKNECKRHSTVFLKWGHKMLWSDKGGTWIQK